MMPTLRATTIYLGGSRYGVVFEYLHSTDCPKGSLPSVTLPCESYEHAWAVTQAFNHKGGQSDG